MLRKGFKLVIIGSVVHAGLIFSATSVSTEASTLALTPVQPFELPDATGISSFIHEYAFSGAQKNNEETNNSRSLQGKFSSLNQILSQVTLKIPDPPTISQSGLDLTVTELTCRELAIGDITLSHTDVSDISQLIGVTISGLQITCNFRWEYRFSFFNGRGDGKALLDNSSSAGITLDFRSDDYNILPPKYVTIPNEKCNSNIQIADMDFDDDGLGMIGEIISLFKGLLTGTVEGELGKLVCEELVGLGDESLDDILEMLSSQIGTYLEPLASDVSDPLHTETNDLEVSIDEEGNALFVNFQELEQYAGEWVQKGLDQLDSLLGRGSNSTDNSALDSSNSPSSNELGINTFIRENLLNEEGSFIVDPSMITSLFSSENSDGVIFEGHDMLTETTMSISSIVVKGLDSFVELDLLNAIGNYTLRNVLKLEQLSFFVEIEAVIK